MFRRNEQRRGHVRGRLLHGVHQPAQHIERVQMADAKRPRKVQRHHGRRTRRGDAVAYEHRPALIPPVAQRSGENAQRHIRRIRADRKHRGAQRRSGFPVAPEDQREIRHRAAQRGKRLRRPEDQVIPHLAGGCFPVVHFDFAPSFSGLRKCKVFSGRSEFFYCSMRAARSDVARSRDNGKDQRSPPLFTFPAFPAQGR